MRELPILFKPDMVRAIREGRKTQTRRVLNHQPDCDGFVYVKRAKDGQKTKRWVGLQVSDPRFLEHCPYGQPGDRLWVRESFYQLKQPPAGAPLGAPCEWVNKPECVRYAEETWGGHEPSEFGYRSRPSIHMPRWASRITLEVLDVRVERVRDISGADAVAEGIQAATETHAIDAFGCLWELINSDRGYGWDVNPWVWVVEFRRMEEACTTSPTYAES